MTLGDFEQEFPEATGGLGNSVSEGGKRQDGAQWGVPHCPAPLRGSLGLAGPCREPGPPPPGIPRGQQAPPSGQWAELDCEAGRRRGLSRGAESACGAGRGGAGRSSGRVAPPRGRGPAAIRSCVPPFRPRVLPAAPTFRPTPARGGPPPRSFLARPQRRPSPQCPAPTGTWACRWRRARKARRMASGKQVIQGAAGTAFAFPGVPSWERARVGDELLKGQKSPLHPALGESRTVGAGSEVQGEHR